MKTLLDEIKEMEADRKYMMEANCPITTPLTDGEHSLGKLPPEIRPLWQLNVDVFDQVVEQESAIQAWMRRYPNFLPSNHDNHGLLNEWKKMDLEHKEIYEKLTIVRLLFQHSLIKAVPASRGFKHIGYRADWELVGIHKTQYEKLQDDMWHEFVKGFNIKLN